MYLHLPHLLLKVVQLFLKTSSNSDIDLQKEQFKDQSNSRLPATPTLGRAALSRGLAGGSPEFNSDYLRHWPSPTSCSTFLCLFVTQPPMFSWTVIKCQMKCISCAFARCISCYILSEFSHSRCQGPSLLLTTAPIDASYNFTLYLDAWKKRPTVMRLWRKDEAKKGDQAEVGFALVDP